MDSGNPGSEGTHSRLGNGATTRLSKQSGRPVPRKALLGSGLPWRLQPAFSRGTVCICRDKLRQPVGPITGIFRRHLFKKQQVLLCARPCPRGGHCREQNRHSLCPREAGSLGRGEVGRSHDNKSYECHEKASATCRYLLRLNVTE